MAAVILLISVTGAYRVVIASLNLLQVTRDHYVAGSISAARLERARNVPYVDLVLLAENGVVVDEFGLPSATGRFRRSTTVSLNAPSSGCTSLLVVTEIRDPRTKVFDSSENVTGVYTEYDSPP